MRLKLFEYFYTTTALVAEAYPNCYSLSSVNYMGENIWGDVHNYRAIFTTNIHVMREFSVTSVTLNGDDPYALWIDGAYVTGADSCCSGVTYSYTFTVGWHRIDLIYSESGGGHYVSLGWNPKDYTAYIDAMTPFGPIDIYNTGTLTMRAGNLGVGTTNPTNKLEVDGGASAVTLRVSTTNTGAGVANLVLSNSSKSAFNDGVKIAHGGGYTNITDLSGTNIMTWDMSNARVGVGLTNPSYKFHVYAAADVSIAAQSAGQNAVRLQLINEERSFILTNNPADDLLSFFYGGANRLQFDTSNQWFNTGRLGVGTTSPTFEVDVAPGVSSATLRVGSWAVMENVTTNQAMFGRNVVYATAVGTGWRNINTGGATAIRMYDDPGDASIGFHLHGSETGGTSLTAWDSTDVKMTIRNGGSVGIGTQSPEAALHVAKTGTDDQLVLGSAATNRDIAMFMYSGTTKAEVLRYQSATRLMLGSGSGISYQSHFASGNEVVRIETGITTFNFYAPGSGVRSYNANSVVRLQNGASDVYLEFRARADAANYYGMLFTDNNVGGYIAFRSYVGSGANDGTNGDYMVYGAYTDHIFQTGSSETVNGKTERMRIKDTNGRVIVQGTLQVSANNATGGGIILADDGDIVDLNDAYCSMRFSAGVRIFSANSGGSAVITLSNGGAITASADITAYSDYRLKTEVKTIDRAIEKVQALRGVTYVRTDKEDKTEKMGVIAQEVKEVIPQVVSQNDDGYYSVAYGNMVGLLIEAIKEQQATITSQGERINSLEKLLKS